jgi:hypothetical protein
MLQRGWRTVQQERCSTSSCELSVNAAVAAVYVCVAYSIQLSTAQFLLPAKPCNYWLSLHSTVCTATCSQRTFRRTAAALHIAHYTVHCVVHCSSSQLSVPSQSLDSSAAGTTTAVADVAAPTFVRSGMLQVEGLGTQGPDNPDGTPQPPPSPTSASVSARVAIVVEAARRGEDLTRLYLSVKRPTGANVQDDDGVGSAVPASSFFADSPVESPTGGATVSNGRAGATVAAAGSALSHGSSSGGHVSGGSGGGGVGSSTTPPVASPVLSDSGRPDSVSRGRRRLVQWC